MKPLITALYLFAAESLYWHVPGRYDFHFFAAAICLLWWILEVDMKDLFDFKKFVESERSFDESIGDDLKRKGLAQVEEKHPRWIDRARAEARIIAIVNGRVSSNDLQRLIAEGTLEPPPHCNAMGAVFRKGFIRIGIEEAKSPQARNRGGGVSVWGVK